MEKQGFLTKNGDYRHCVLAHGELQWSLKQFGKVKNTITLKAYRLVRNSPTELSLQPQVGKRDVKPYTLVSSDKKDSDEWEVAIKSWLVSGVAADQMIAEHGPVQRDPSKLSGWLQKKGLRRFFFIDANVLYWAEKEIEPSTPDFKKKISGSLELCGDATVTMLDDNTFEVTSFAGANYTLTTTLKSETREWIAALTQILTLHGMSASDAVSPKEIENRGYLTKKGKTRFLLLKKNHVFWYESENDSNAKGSLPLARVTVSPLGAMGFKLCTSDYKEYEWTAKSVGEASEWIEKIRNTARLAKARDYDLRAAKRLEGGDSADECFFKHTLVKKKGKSRVLVLRGKFHQTFIVIDESSKSKSK